MRGRLVARLREVSSNICSTRAIGSVTRFSFKLVSHLCVCFPQTIVCGSALYKYASEDFLSFLSPVCLTGFLKTLPPNGPFLSNSFFSSKIAMIESKSATIDFFSSPLFFLLALSFFFSFPFPSLVWVRSLSGPRNPPFNAFSLKWRQILLGWFSKNRWQS